MCLGVPAEIVAFDETESGRAKVSLSGVERMISTDLLADEGLKVGDWVLVHVGFAMSQIDADEAATTLEQIKKVRTVRGRTRTVQDHLRRLAPT